MRYFGYDDKLQIRPSIYEDGSVLDEEIELCKNVELSKEG